MTKTTKNLHYVGKQEAKTWPENQLLFCVMCCYSWSCDMRLVSPCQEQAGKRTTRRLPDHRKKTQTAVVWSCLSFTRSGKNQHARHSENGQEDKADRGRGGKTTLGNGQAWSLPCPREQWRTGKNGSHWLWNHLWCPNDPRGSGIDGDDDVIWGREISVSELGKLRRNDNCGFDEHSKLKFIIQSWAEHVKNKR